MANVNAASELTIERNDKLHPFSATVEAIYSRCLRSECDEPQCTSSRVRGCCPTEHARDDEATRAWSATFATDDGKTVPAVQAVGRVHCKIEQLNVFRVVAPIDRLALLEDEVKYLENDRHEGDEPREVYFSGDESRAAALLRSSADVNKGKPAPLAFEKRLLGDRSQRMIERIRARLRDGKPRLYAVGMAHLVGDNGVVALLRRSGMKVVRFAPLTRRVPTSGGDWPAKI